MTEPRSKVQEIHQPRVFRAGLPGALSQASHDLFLTRVVHKTEQGLVWKTIPYKVLINQFQAHALLQRVVILRKVLLCDGVEPGREFHANDLSERVLGCQEQRSAFA